MMAGMINLILIGLLRGVRTQRSLVLENLALRHQCLPAARRRIRARKAMRPLDDGSTAACFPVVPGASPVMRIRLRRLSPEVPAEMDLFGCHSLSDTTAAAVSLARTEVMTGSDRTQGN